MRFIDREEVARRLTYDVCIPIVRQAMIAFSKDFSSSPYRPDDVPWESAQRKQLLNFRQARLTGLGSDRLKVGWPADEWLPLDRRRFRPHPNLSTTGRHRMNLPDAPIAHEGFFATHFFTVRDQEKSKDFYVRILGGKVTSRKIPATSSWLIPYIPAAGWLKAADHPISYPGGYPANQ